MMGKREIKFRAWDKRSKQMLRDVQGAYNWSTYLYTDMYELMQYTGLHDKNGKEIYEGDILKNHNDSTLLGVVVFGYYNIGRDSWDVEIKTPCFCQAWQDNSGYSCIDDYVEVIGNIYETPELLKERLA